MQTDKQAEFSANERIPGKVYAAVIATGILSFSGVIVETSMNIAFPTLMREFGVSTNIVQWMTSIYLLTLSIVVPLSANLKARFATKSLFLTAAAFFMAGLLTDALAPVFPVLLFGRVLQGVGTGLALPLMYNIIIEQVPLAKRGSMMGGANVITGIAPAVGPTFGGIVISTLGWRWVFWILLPLLLVSLFLGIWGIQQKSKLVKAPVDLPSFVAIVVLFSGLLFGLSNLSSGRFFTFSCGGCMLIGLLALFCLTWRSRQLANPILDLSLFKNRNFALQMLGFFLLQTMSLGHAFLLPNYIQLVNGKSALLAGIVVLPAGCVSALLCIVGGRLYDKHGARKPVLLAGTCVFLEVAVMLLLVKQLTPVAIGVTYPFYMGGMAITMCCIMTDALNQLPTSQQTQGNAIMTTLQQFAGAFGTSVTTAVVAFSQAQAGSKGSAATAQGTRLALMLMLLFALVMLAAFLASTKDKQAD